MFTNDRPISSKNQDRLGRRGFSENLAKSILDWKDADSLVIALYGKWGSGKSSIINIVKETIDAVEAKQKPTVIDFNPWLFSGDDGILLHFFNEVSAVLKIKNRDESDKELARKLRTYASLFRLLPGDNGIQQILIMVGVLGISAGHLLKVFNIDSEALKSWGLVAGIVLVLIGTFFDRLAEFFENKSGGSDRSIEMYKEEVADVLRKRKEKVLIILDDLDRLSPREMRLVFKLIKVAADFPNVIFLLSFDREVVEKALEQQKGTSGKEYIEKIVQVSFDVPFSKQEKTASVLFERLDEILAQLPKKSEALFDQTYWGNIYHSGLKEFFKTIRHVKRFSSSLEFNISLLTRGDSIEVNPIDFIAIEAIRLFEPKFYGFMKTRKELFTSTRELRNSGIDNPRTKEIKEGLELISPEFRESVEPVLTRLFPQLEGVLKHGYSTYGSGWVNTWNRSLRICSPEFFDAYFTLLPGGDESRVSQYEIDTLLDSATVLEKFTEHLRLLIKNDKIKQTLERLEAYTDGSSIAEQLVPNMVQGLLDVSDELPTRRSGMFDFGTDLQNIRVLSRILRNRDKGENLSLLLDAISKSQSVHGATYFVELEVQGVDEGKGDAISVPSDKIKELQAACIELIKAHWKAGDLINNKHLLSILFSWKSWGVDDSWKGFAAECILTDQGLINFVKLFIGETFSQTFGDYVGRKKKVLNKAALEQFIDVVTAKGRLERIKAEGHNIYLESQAEIDISLKSLEDKDIGSDD